MTDTAGPVSAPEPVDAAPLSPPVAPPAASVNVNVAAVSPYGPPLPPKSTGVAYLLWLLLGIFGGHQFYMGKIGRGVLYLLTGGVLMVGWIIDLFTLPSQIKTVNARRAVGMK